MCDCHKNLGHFIIMIIFYKYIQMYFKYNILYSVLYIINYYTYIVI